jgi:predicted nucleotidyltransferase
VDDPDFSHWLTGELADLPGVIAVTLGGSRARGTHDADSDWDFAVYYRTGFDPDALRAKGWSGEVSEIGGWGAGVMNGGAWLTVDDRRVDVHYRDLEDVEHWCTEAEAGRFEKQLLLFYVAAIPTYVVMAELAPHEVLAGELPRPLYPEALARQASRRWQADAVASIAYAEAAVRRLDDVAVGLANGARGLIEVAHGRLAERREWVVNEKGIVEHAGLDPEADLLMTASNPTELLDALRTVRGRLDAPG